MSEIIASRPYRQYKLIVGDIAAIRELHALWDGIDADTSANTLSMFLARASTARIGAWRAIEGAVWFHGAPPPLSGPRTLSAVSAWLETGFRADDRRRVETSPKIFAGPRGKP